MTPREIAEKAVNTAQEKAENSAGRLFVLAFAGGAFIALGSALSVAVGAFAQSPFTSKLLCALAFPLGLFLIVAAGAELFTGDALMLVGLFAKRVKAGRLLRTWGIVYAGNIIGSLAVAMLMWGCGVFTTADGVCGQRLAAIAQSKCALGFTQAFFLAVACNVLVCAAVWISFGAKSVGGKLAAVFLPVFAFVFCGFEHSVANMFYLPAGLIAHSVYGYGSQGITLGSMGMNLLSVTLGNVVGGAIFSAVYFVAYLKGSMEKKND